MAASKTALTFTKSELFTKLGAGGSRKAIQKKSYTVTITYTVKSKYPANSSAQTVTKTVTYEVRNPCAYAN